MPKLSKSDEKKVLELIGKLRELEIRPAGDVFERVSVLQLQVNLFTRLHLLTTRILLVSDKALSSKMTTVHERPKH